MGWSPAPPPWPAPPPSLDAPPPDRIPGALAGRVAAVLISITVIASLATLAIYVVVAGRWSVALTDDELVLLELTIATDLLVLASFVGAAASFLTWLYRTSQVAPRLGAGTPDHTPRASVGWWFVPFANFVMPLIVVGRLFSQLAVRPRPTLGWLPVAWWVSYIAAHVALGVSEDPYFAPTAAAMRAALGAYAAGQLTFALAGVLVIWLIVETEKRKHVRAMTLAADPSRMVV